MFLCLSVCLFVRHTFSLRLTVFLLPLSEVQCPNFFGYSESLGESNGKKWSRIWTIFLKMIFISFTISQNMVGQIDCAAWNVDHHIWFILCCECLCNLRLYLKIYLFWLILSISIICKTVNSCIGKNTIKSLKSAQELWSQQIFHCL